MLSDEKKLTPAQSALLSFASPLEADSIYEYLHTTLGLSITGYTSEDSTSVPTPKTLTAWYFTLEMMLHLHMISVEERKLATSKLS
jgi:hypothetical protein